MRLSLLYSEELDVIKSAYDFYGDPKSKVKSRFDDSDNMSFLQGGHKDRDKFANKMNKNKKSKK